MFEKDIKIKSCQYYNKFKTAWKMRGMEQQDLEQELHLFTFKTLKSKVFETKELQRNYIFKSWSNHINWLLKRTKSWNTVDIDNPDHKETFENLAFKSRGYVNKKLTLALNCLDIEDKALITDRYIKNMDFKDIALKNNKSRMWVNTKLNSILKN
jgi:hypothetical protein